ncbi:metal ABC transporter solute-binding protein, Zn/Mn family, partial [Escherichia coli]|uniref:metal ABC transporter solute-binding protein, Zn/Mn family n=1 Tax=Escherichia coli TaxID=562 RepID=UPI0039172E98
KTSIFSHPVYLFLRKFSLQDSRGGSISDKPARQVARETGAHYGGVLYVDSLSTENGPVPTYIDLLKVTTSTLVQGIKAGKREK